MKDDLSLPVHVLIINILQKFDFSYVISAHDRASLWRIKLWIKGAPSEISEAKNKIAKGCARPYVAVLAF